MRWVIRTGAAALVILVAAALAIWLTLRASLPQLDGEVAAPGLANRATIERDNAGIATVSALTRRDLAYATGFAHGQDRFFQMDLIRRQAAGELSELFGEIAIDVDKRSTRATMVGHDVTMPLAIAPVGLTGLLDLDLHPVQSTLTLVQLLLSFLQPVHTTV